MKERVQWEADDGTMWATQDACALHERTEGMVEYIRTHPLKNATPEALAQWLTENVTEVRHFVADADINLEPAFGEALASRLSGVPPEFNRMARDDDYQPPKKQAW